MKVRKLDLEGLLVIELDVHRDDRGFFLERFHQDEFRKLNVPLEFKQDNHSRSAPRVLRGLHFQIDPPQGKLIGVTRGRIWDVAVDIRPDSQTFGKHLGIELNESNPQLLYMPPGFAHGFCVLGNEDADVFYKTSTTYNQKGEGGIRWDDPELDISWPIKEPLVSDRDQSLGSLAQFLEKQKRA